jgi:hypothetical protein
MLLKSGSAQDLNITRKPKLSITIDIGTLLPYKI